MYYNINHLNDPKNKMIINRALLKYGYSNFKLIILEYCDTSVIIKREQYYINQLKPDYNINPTAGSSLGFKHSEYTKGIMSRVKRGLKFSELTRERMRISAIERLKRLGISGHLRPPFKQAKNKFFPPPPGPPPPPSGGARRG